MLEYRSAFPRLILPDARYVSPPAEHRPPAWHLSRLFQLPSGEFPAFPSPPPQTKFHAFRAAAPPDEVLPAFSIPARRTARLLHAMIYIILLFFRAFRLSFRLMLRCRPYIDPSC